MAEALFALELSRESPGLARTRSAGLRATLGRSSPPDALSVAKEMGVSLVEHRAQPLTRALVREADLFVVMDRNNEVVLLSRYPEALGRTVLLGSFDPESRIHGAEIADPFGHGDNTVRDCYRRLARAVQGLVRSIAAVNERAHAEPNQVLRRPLRAFLTSPLIIPIFSPFTRSSATIFMMHRFACVEAGTDGHDPTALRRNLEYLRRHRFHISSLDELVSRLQAGQSPLPRTVVFTIDDAYGDFGNVAAPIFEAFDCPATIFLITGFLDRERWMWWDKVRYLLGPHPIGEVRYRIGDRSSTLRWTSAAERNWRAELLVERLKRVPTEVLEAAIQSLEAAAGHTIPTEIPTQFAPMTWDAVRVWARRGFDFAPHTRTHPVLSQATAEQSAAEIHVSFNRLRQAAGKALPIFAYPNGMQSDFGDRERAAVKQAGMIAAVSAFGGYCTARHFAADPYALPRVPYVESARGFLQVVGGVEGLKNSVRTTTQLFHSL